MGAQVHLTFRNRRKTGRKQHSLEAFAGNSHESSHARGLWFVGRLIGQAGV